MLCVASSTPAFAQETIYDPENPAVSGVEESEEESDESDEETSDGGEETIFDPENPAVQAKEEGEQDAELSEPTLEPVEEETEPAPSNADFLGVYATSLAVDTAWEGGDEDIVEWTNQFGLRLEYDMPEQTRAVIEGEFYHWMVGKRNPDETNLLINAERGRASYEPRLGEAYILKRADAWSFRLGNLVNSWGSTDIVRPGDVVNPTNLTDLDTQATSADILLPQLTGEIAYTAPNWSLTGLVVPFFEPNEVVVFGRDVALANPQNPILSNQLPVLAALEQVIDPSRWDDVQSVLFATRVPDERPGNASLGARATLTQWNTDFGLGYFYGWDRTPFIEFDEDLQALINTTIEDGQVLQDFNLLGFIQRNPEVLGLTASVTQKAADGEELFFSEYRRRHTLVADVARFVGPIGVRADVAFTPEQTLYTRTFEAVRRATVFGALGLSWERLRGEDDIFLATLEGFWLHPFDRDSGINKAFVADDELGPADAELLLIRDGVYGAAAAMQWRVPVIDADLQLGVLGTLSTEDVIATASVGRRWYSWLQTTVGVSIFEGPDVDDGDPISLGGLYDRNDQVTLTVDGVF